MVAAQKADAFRYTSLCRFFLSGKCDRGEDCFFAHDESQLREKPDLFKTRICRIFSRTGRCKDGDDCKYAHSQEEVRNTGVSVPSRAEEAAEKKSRKASVQMEVTDPELSQAGPSETLACPMMSQWPSSPMGGAFGFCGSMGWPQHINGYKIVGWVPASVLDGNMGWMAGGKWQEQAELGEVEKTDGSLTWDPIGDESNESAAEMPQQGAMQSEHLSWDPLGMQQPDVSSSSASGSSSSGSELWDPIGISTTDSTRDGLAMYGLDASVVRLAARSLEMTPAEEPHDKEHCLSTSESVQSTCGSEESMSEGDADASDDEDDSVFEAWAAGITESSDAIMHKGIGYELGVRNTFLSFGPAGTAKRIMLSKSRSMPQLVAADA